MIDEDEVSNYPHSTRRDAYEKGMTVGIKTYILENNIENRSNLLRRILENWNNLTDHDLFITENSVVFSEENQYRKVLVVLCWKKSIPFHFGRVV